MREMGVPGSTRTTSEWRPGDSARLRKRHPCGADRWLITRVGADIGLRCCRCRRRLLLPRARFARALLEIIPAARESEPHCAS